MNTPHAIASAAAQEGGQALLPRINVHIFCEAPQTAPIMQAVAADRRMSRANVDIYSGGIPAATQYYAQTPTPHLLIVESVKQREELLAELAGLAQVCSPETRVIVIGHVNDITLYRELISQGVGDYLVMPLDAQKILASASQMFLGSETAVMGRIVTFMGAKGGVGASVIAHNIAWLLSGHHGIGTVIADLDLAFGTAGLDFNEDPPQGMLEALSSKDRLDSVLIDRLLHKCSERLLLLAAPGSVDRVIDIQAETLEIVLDLLRSSNPMTVLDMPTTWAGWMKAAVQQTDTMVIVATPELASLRNTKSLVDNMKSMRPNDEPPLLVLNQMEMGKRPEIPAAEFARAAGLEVTSIIPFDAQSFGQAVTNGQMIAEAAPKSQAAAALEELARRICGLEEGPAPKKGGSLLGSLLGKLSKKA